ncbi:tripartite tricarboxylate transporter substrate binding protein [Variovorax sp. J22R133]|uniref:Bug family tripartite tricarboxylate transporter substrate binding protein n=1 Tax=Variovorax brevis TaxID=3053503 RepID=UPI002575702C|nr:tripartite tricarboxylate transporter substrate binding protein [Variovorax sp. J22R133]MDM0117149.1 tripartite tricarboxylate transporter substrate binding protein [Variovorax sp. J22R133]
MTSSSVSRRSLGTAIAALAMLAASASFAQAPSDKVLRIIAAGPPGGSLDLVSRLLAQGLQTELNRPVIVEAKPGGGGTLAVSDLMHSPRDGSTVLVSLNAMVSEIPHAMKTRVDMFKEVKPIAELSRAGIVMVGNPALPATNLGEMIGHVKANPGKVSFASYSAGTISHVMGLQLNKAAGIDMLHVAYKGTPPALADVMGGHVQLMFAGLTNSLPLIKAGKVVPFAVSLPLRSPLLPNVPTFTELGYPQLENVGWNGLWVTPDVPADIQKRLRDAALKVMAQTATREQLKQLGLDVGQPRTPEEMTQALHTDYSRIGVVLKSIDFKPE